MPSGKSCGPSYRGCGNVPLWCDRFGSVQRGDIKGGATRGSHQKDRKWDVPGGSGAPRGCRNDHRARQSGGVGCQECGWASGSVSNKGRTFVAAIYMGIDINIPFIWDLLIAV